jgi:hypothetical protein
MAKRTNIRSLYVAEEVAFGTDPDADGSDYVYLHAETDLPTFVYEMVENALQNDRLVKSAPDVGGQKGSFSFKAPLRANGANAGAGAAAPELDLVLKHCIGAVTRGTGTTVGDASTATEVVVASAAGITRGGYVVVEVGGVPYLRLVHKIAANVLHVFPALPGAPANGQKVYAASYYTPAAAVTSLAFVVVVDDVPVTFLGCKAVAKVSGFTPNGKALLEVSVEADSFVVGGKASLPAANDRFPAVRTPVVLGAPFLYGAWTRATDVYTLAQKLIAGADFDPGRALIHQETTEGANGRSGVEPTAGDPKMNVEAYYDAAFLTDMGNGADLLAAFGVGTASPHLTGWGLSFLKARIVDLAPADRSGLYGQKLSLGAYDNDANPEFVLSVF